MQTPTPTKDPLAGRVPETVGRPRLERHRRTIALCAAVFIAGVAVGAGGRSKKTAVVVRVHNRVMVRNEGTIGILVRAARGS
jgi:hypothetical protein